ncbi:MAG: response regulator [Thermodesulfobacteriota bacterium]|nr:response regulator [Thermodesulfobacteriota bacterium]
MSMTEHYKNTILVVDDEEGILEISVDYFERKGYRVYIARNGQEALDIAEKADIGCCFTDINMPVMDGLELAEKLREMDNTLPVVVMTGFPSLENTIHTLKNGVVDYLIKPVNLEQMELCFKRIMRERGLFVENLIFREEVERQERLKKLNNELVTRVEELNTLNRIMEDFAIHVSSNEIFRKVVELSRDVVKADEVHFYIYSENSTSLVSLSHSGVEKALFDTYESFILKIINDDKPCLISKASGINNFPEKVQSAMVVPLRIREKSFGVITASMVQGNRRFSSKDLYYLNFISQKAASAIESIALYENIYDNLFSTLYAFVATLEARDPYTRKHSTRVAEVAYLIGQEMDCTDEELDVLSFAGHLHDIGKIGIRDEILLKPGRLTPEEFEKIKEHPAIGAEIIGKLGLWEKEQEIIRHHHERFDGTGYPDHLKDNEIPFLARILSVADTFDAMDSDRAYRKRMAKGQIFKTIKQGAGTQFDPAVVKAFLSLAEKTWPEEFSPAE